METPLSSRRITRSQAKIMNSEPVSSISGVENEECLLLGGLKSIKNQEREKSALIDITNGSPIVGLAMGSLKTPSSRCSKKRMMIPSSESKKTPGSGESLLRGQVKTLLQKVEEEGVISKICFEPNSLIRKRFVNSPMAVLAPTPTPQVYDFSISNNKGLESFTVSPPVAENFNFTQMLNEIIAGPNQEDKCESETKEKDVITRSLFMDFSEKSEGSESSLWSVQVNASTSEEYKDDADNNEDGDDVVVDELCEGISKMSVGNAATFTGKHTRFVYNNSDGELEGELESSSSSSNSVSGILCLKGLPIPEGKHLRFAEEEEEEE